MAVVTPTDRLKSVRKRCVIELFVALFVLSLCLFDIPVGVGAFVIGLSQISSFFSKYVNSHVVYGVSDPRYDNHTRSLHIMEYGKSCTSVKNVQNDYLH